MRAVLTASVMAIGLALSPLAAFVAPSAQAAEVLYSVNGQAVTSYDVQRRAAFLKLQGLKGGTAKATEEIIDQTLVMQEAARLGVRVAPGDVDASFARFAKGNNMSIKQISGILDQSGVTAKHFKEFIRAQMTMAQMLQVRERQSGTGVALTTQDMVAKMLEQGGAKPTSTEYVLQQVIFVVPANEQGRKAARKKEADALRARFESCESTRSFAKGLIDVTVRDLGRVLEPELPPEWKDQIIKAGTGGVTPARTTDRGAEFIAVCRTRAVSDDKVAELQFRADQVATTTDSGGGKAYVEDLRKNAQIIKR